MTRRLPLSVLASLIQETIESVFDEETFWVIAELTDVKKYEQKRWCFLKFVEKSKEHIVTEMQGVFWSNAYQQIIRFEQATGQAFTNGIEISCRVAVRFHPRYGLKLEVQEIDPSFTLGQMEMQRQQTLDKLLQQYPTQIQLIDGEYITANKRLSWPKVLQRVALIAAEGSDGHRDFVHELLQNQYGYQFKLTTFHASVQGQQAVADICDQLQFVHQIASSFDVVAIVRGGGSNTDFAAFDDFEIARRIALFPIPVFTGIGHDRNTSIADLMGWQFKTPTKAAAAIVDTALRFESELMALKDQLFDFWQHQSRYYEQRLAQWNNRLQDIIPYRLQRRYDRLYDWQQLVQRTAKDEVKYYRDTLAEKSKHLLQDVQRLVQQKHFQLSHLNRLVEQMSPDAILNRGYALVMQDETVITHSQQLDSNKPMKTVMKTATIISHIKEINQHEG